MSEKNVETKEISVEERLRALYNLQMVVSEIDKIRTIRGELPLEVQDLEDEVAGLKTRIEKCQNDLQTLARRSKFYHSSQYLLSKDSVHRD